MSLVGGSQILLFGQNHDLLCTECTRELAGLSPVNVWSDWFRHLCSQIHLLRLMSTKGSGLQWKWESTKAHRLRSTPKLLRQFSVKSESQASMFIPWEQERECNLQRAVTLPQNVNRPTADSSLHNEGEEDEGLAGWLGRETQTSALPKTNKDPEALEQLESRPW